MKLKFLLLAIFLRKFDKRLNLKIYNEGDEYCLSLDIRINFHVSVLKSSKSFLERT